MPSHPLWPLALSSYLAHPSLDPLSRTQVQNNLDLQDTHGALLLEGVQLRVPRLRCLRRTGAVSVTVLQASGARMGKPGLLRVTEWQGEVGEQGPGSDAGSPHVSPEPPAGGNAALIQRTAAHKAWGVAFQLGGTGLVFHLATYNLSIIAMCLIPNVVHSMQTLSEDVVCSRGRGPWKRWAEKDRAEPPVGLWAPGCQEAVSDATLEAKTMLALDLPLGTTSQPPRGSSSPRGGNPDSPPPFSTLRAQAPTPPPRLGPRVSVVMSPCCWSLW